MLFLIGFAFGLTFVLNRIATTNGIPFFAYVFWQAAIGALILLIICTAARSLPSLSSPYLKKYLVTGTLNVSLPICILSFVAPKVPAGVLSLGLMLIPTMIYALALTLGMDRFSWVRLIGIALGFAGVLLVVLPSASLPSPDLTGWVLLGLLAPVCYAFGAIIMSSMGPAAARTLPLACGLLWASVRFGTDDVPGCTRQRQLVVFWWPVRCSGLGSYLCRYQSSCNLCSYVRDHQASWAGIFLYLKLHCHDRRSSSRHLVIRRCS